MDVLHLAHVNRQHLEGKLVTVGGVTVYHIGDGLDNPHARVKALDNQVTVDLDAVVAQVGRVGGRPVGNLDHGTERVGLFAREKAACTLVLGDFQMQRRGLAHEQSGTVEPCLEGDVTAPCHGCCSQHQDGCHHDMSHVL